MSDFYLLKINKLRSEGKISPAAKVVLQRFARYADDRGRVLKTVKELVPLNHGTAHCLKVLREKGILSIVNLEEPINGMSFYYRLMLGQPPRSSTTITLRNNRMADGLRKIIAMTDDREVKKFANKLLEDNAYEPEQIDVQTDHGTAGGKDGQVQGDSEGDAGGQKDVPGAGEDEQTESEV